jgi:hypothetical protein
VVGQGSGPAIGVPVENVTSFLPDSNKPDAAKQPVHRFKINDG